MNSSKASSMGMAACDVSIELGGLRVVDGVTFDLAPATTLGIIGPNGSGKSTLIRGLLGLQPLAAGQVLVAGRSVSSYRRRDLARLLAGVLQDETGDFALDATDVVAMGRGCHRKLFERDSERDLRVVSDSLAAVDAAHLARRPIASMSGGERQRVLVARALAQEPQILVMDEPTNHLDIRHQFEVLSLARDRKLTAVVALHDLNLAAAYCDLLLVLRAGRVMALGTPGEVLRPGLLSDLYDVETHVGLDTPGGVPHVYFRPADPVAATSIYPLEPS